MLARKWVDLGDDKVCSNVVKLWKEREKRRKIKEEKEEKMKEIAAEI